VAGITLTSSACLDASLVLVLISSRTFWFLSWHFGLIDTTEPTA